MSTVTASLSWSQASAIAATPALTPAATIPIVVYAYRLPSKEQLATASAGSSHDPEFTRIPLSVNGTATVGTQIIYGDFDHDGDIDIATAGKLGVHVLENLKVDHTPKDVREATQPIDRAWPFPGEGKEVPQDDLPAK